MTSAEFAIVAISSVVAVLEPASTIAVYETLSKDMTAEEKRGIIFRASLISFLVLIFFAVTGHLVFLVFNVTVAAFKIAGGILLVDVAFGMFHPSKREYSSETRKDIAVIPLAFPLTSGPGAITTVILLVSQASSIFESSFVFIGIIIGISITYAAMIYSDWLFKRLGYQGLDVITALMSIIVMAIAVQFIISGITAAFPSILGISSSA